MGRIAGILVVLAILWGGYWFVGSRAVLQGVEAAVAGDARFTATDIRVAGFPNRFDTTLEDPRFQGAGVAWAAPFFQSFALTYKPTHLVFVWPETQVVAFPGGVVEIAQEDLRASVVFEGISALRLGRTTLVGDGLEVTAPTGDVTQIAAIRAATRRVDEAGMRHDAAIEIDGLVLPEVAREAVFPGRGPEFLAGTLRLDTTLGFSAPLERASLQAAAPLVTEITVNSVDAAWGPMGLSGQGTIRSDARGRAEGRLMLTFENWPDWFEMATATGLLRPETAPTWRNAAETLAKAEGDPEDLTAPLIFQNGLMFFGPLPLGPAPRLR